MTFELIIRNARLRRKEETVDIGIAQGSIQEIRPKINQDGKQEIDASSKLVTAPFVDPHIHLDKCLTGQWAILGRHTADKQIELARQHKASFTKSDIKQRAAECLRAAIANGTLFVRGFVDVDTVMQLKGLDALLEVKNDFKAAVDLQIVAFPQEGILRDPGSDELLWKAMERGADIVGGIPWFEITDEDMKTHLDIIFEVAKKHDSDVHMLDNSPDPYCRALEYTSIKTIREGYQERVTYSSVPILSYQSDYYASKVIGLVKRAGITIVCNAPAALFCGGLKDRQPKGRGITRVGEFLEAGVNVASGQDDVNDPYYPFGIPDQLEVAAFMAHVGHFYTPQLIEVAYDMVTDNAARSLRLKDYGIEQGKSADMLILDSTSVHEALRFQAERLYVIKKGSVIAENRSIKRLNIEK